MELLINALVGMAIVIIPVLTTFIVALIKSKTEQIRSKTANTNAVHYLDIAEKSILTAIESVAQNYVIELKANKNFDDAAQAKALNKAKVIVLQITSDTVQDAIEEAHGDINAWVTNSIDAKIKELKENKTESDNLIQALNSSVEIIKPIT